MHRLVAELGRKMVADLAHPEGTVQTVMRKLDALLPAPSHQSWWKYNAYLGHLSSIAEQCARYKPQGREVWSLLYKTAVYLQESARLASLDANIAAAIEQQMHAVNAALFGADRVVQILELALQAARLTEANARRLLRAGIDLYLACEYAAALPLLSRALEIHDRLLGPEHPDTLISVNNLAALLWAKGDLAAAEPLFRRGLEGCGPLLGEEHPDTLTSVDNLAGLLQIKGNLAAAEPLFRRALAGWERVLGAEHSRAVTARNNLGALL